MRVLNKKISTLVAVIFLLIGVIVTSILVQERIIVFQNAAPSENPQNVRISNISDSTFTITYTTDASVIGTLSLSGGGQNSEVILDERDEASGTPKPYMVHSISAKDLSPNTAYTFKILSGTTTFVDGDKPFSLTTPPKLSDSPTQQEPLAGKVLLPDGTKPTEALIFVTANNGQLLSTLLNPAGLYILPLNLMRTKDLSSLIAFTSDSTLQILAIDQSLSSHVIVGMTGINPVPPITLSQDYDFTLSRTPLATGSAQVNFPILSFTNTSLQATPEIITPQNNQSFTDQQPQFKGTAAPNSTVTISIHSDAAITTQVTTDSNGNWIYRPTVPLSAGVHTITITTPDAYGILHTLTQTFTVFASGSQVNESATPSATLTPSVPTATPTKTPAFLTPTPTPKPLISATNTPIPVVSTKPTPAPTLPPTGSNTFIVAGSAGIATTIVGVVLFMITSGAL